ncbi:TPA: glycosyl transferase [Candidatus Delongbacteria bacterium]|nr:glycosyl transferase [Candidatus Delongbacteria bacterium]
MSKFNPVEKYFADLLSKFPKAKNGIKKLYTVINYYTHRKKYSFKSDFKIKPVVSDENNESFFGYYDKSPVNSSGKYIIFHETDGIISNKAPDPKKHVKIMLCDSENNDYSKITETSSYNWQQGCRLQWLNESKFIFNDFNGSYYISKIYNIESKEFATIDSPIYDCYKDEFALSVNFSRLNSTDKDYGYKNIAFNPVQNTLENDGIFLVDLKSNTSKLLIDFEKVIGLHPQESMKNAQHCFNHIMINPDGKSFIFIHRWYQSGRRYDSLILSNFEGTKIKVLADQDFVSHCCWYYNETVVGYLSHNSYGKSYYRIDIKTGQTELLSDKLKLFGDGHPSFFGNNMLFDSYPDRSRMQHLYIFDVEKDEVKEIGCFLSPLKFFGATRCDLHPRWSSDGKSIYFDSTHEGKRKLYKIIF